MNAILRFLTAAALLGAALWVGVAGAQGPGSPTLVFRNDTKFALVVQGTSSINGMLRRGQPLLLPPGRTATEFNVPVGFRLYSIFDANQPTQVLLRDKAIMIQPGRDLALTIVQSPTNPLQVGIIESK